MASSLRLRLLEPRDIASLVVFRFLFGAILCVSSVRFLWKGWIDQFYVQPSFFFKYWGFEWVRVLPEPWMTVLYVAMAVLAAFVAIGFLYRAAIIALFLVFTYVELIDGPYSLTHYSLVSLFALLMCFLPLHRAHSVDALLWPTRTSREVPAWMLYLMRFQVGIVYFYAGIAKLQPDWLIHAQPLGIWLAARTDAPVIGTLLTWPAMPHIMSWAGFLNDTLVVPFLLWKRTRPYAFATVVVFHFCTHLLFVIGVFPFLMVCGATLFFEPDWPRRLVARWRPQRDARAVIAPGRHAYRWSAPVAVLVATYCMFQVVMPLRAFLYPGDVLWHEQGMRYSWRVMVREKNGSIGYRVRWRGSERDLHVPPRHYLTSHQEREMSGQPDLILQLAHHIADDFEIRGHEDVEVRVDAVVSLNGRRTARMVDPNVDLSLQLDALTVMPWIMRPPEEEPLPAYPT
ncbi:MAG: HTTM domain-containing protein, partial [Polyangiales bacterium]